MFSTCSMYVTNSTTSLQTPVSSIASVPYHSQESSHSERMSITDYCGRIELVTHPEMVNATYGKLFGIFNILVACSIIENWSSICCLTHIENDTFHTTFSMISRLFR